MSELSKSELFVEAVRVASCKNPAPQPLQLWVSDYRLHKPFAKAAAAKFAYNKNIADIRKRRKIAYDARKADQLLSSVDAEAKRILDCSFGLFARAIFCPIRF